MDSAVKTVVIFRLTSHILPDGCVGSVHVCGNAKELGEWKPAKAFPLVYDWDQKLYLGSIALPSDSVLSYKYVFIGGTDSTVIEWERFSHDKGFNRTLDLKSSARVVCIEKFSCPHRAGSGDCPERRPLYNFVDTEETLLPYCCSSCKSIPHPSTALQCSIGTKPHVICMDCVEKSEKCTQCGLSWGVDRSLVSPVSEELQETMQTLKLRCDHYVESDGCTWEGAWTDLTAHLADCKFEPVPCDWPECSTAPPRKHAAIHKDICTMRVVKCPQCAEQFVGSQLRHHLRNEECMPAAQEEPLVPAPVVGVVPNHAKSLKQNALHHVPTVASFSNYEQKDAAMIFRLGNMLENVSQQLQSVTTMLRDVEAEYRAYRERFESQGKSGHDIRLSSPVDNMKAPLEETYGAKISMLQRY
mmetsp:Transcript_32338/g.52244  ORF Transcript_32338/g.52244 Transcript_32338/m.52244 type:complete len:414 (-) Transcript_32338:580-1821(-)